MERSMKHRILIIEMTLELYTSQSLKEKRKIKRSLMDKLKKSYNISLAETAYQDYWQRIGLSLAYVALNESRAVHMAEHIRRSCDEWLMGEGEVNTFNVEIF